MTVLAGYIGALVAFVAADMIWLGIMVGRVYRPPLANILAANVNLPAAAVFYLVFPIGLTIFAVAPALKSGSLGTALMYGALFGFFTYATYDLTNQATLRDWTTQLTLIDVAWGTTLGAIAAMAGFIAASRFGGGA